MYRHNFLKNYKNHINNFIHQINDYKKENPSFDLEKIYNPVDLKSALYPDYFYHNYK
jgi:hypothetical protein